MQHRLTKHWALPGLWGICLVVLCLACHGSARAEDSAEKAAKELYKQYRKLPSKDRDARQVPLRRILKEHPQTKTAIQAAKALSYIMERGGPWPDLPSRATVLVEFLAGPGGQNPRAAYLRRDLLKLYQAMGRWDLSIALLKKMLATPGLRPREKQDANYQLALANAYSGHKRAARDMFQQMVAQTRDGETLKERAQYALEQLEKLNPPPFDMGKVAKQATLGAKLFAGMKPYSYKDREKHRPTLERISRECWLTYHGRWARLKLAGLEPDQARSREAWAALMRENPFDKAALRAWERLQRSLRKEGRQAAALELDAERIGQLLDSTYAKRRKAWFELARGWEELGRYQEQAHVLKNALALQGNLDPMPHGLAKLISQLSRGGYPAGAQRLELIGQMLKICQPGPRTAQALMDYARQFRRGDYPDLLQWPDYEASILIWQLVKEKFAADKAAKSVDKEIERAREEMGLWLELARTEQARFDKKYQDRDRWYPGAAIRLAAAWQRAGQTAKAKELLGKLAGRKYLKWEDKKRIGLIAKRMEAWSPPAPAAIKARQEAAELYGRIRSIKDKPGPGDHKEMVAARLPLAEKLAAKYAQTYHGHQAARAMLRICLHRGRDQAAACQEMAEKFLAQYAHWEDGENLWRDLLKQYQRAEQPAKAAELMERAARQWAHFWDLDEQKLAMEVGQAWLAAKKPAKALPWLKLVSALDETGESRLAKKADKLAAKHGAELPGQEKKPAETGPLSKEAQEKLARELYRKASKTPKWRLKDFKEIYTTIIERCPDTAQAQSAHWRLSNLYLLAYDPPLVKETIALLEGFLAKYPRSKGVPPVRRRLYHSYEKAGLFCKAADLQKIAIGKGEYPRAEGQIQATIKLYMGVLKKCGRKKALASWQKLQQRGGSGPEKIDRAKKQGLLAP